VAVLPLTSLSASQDDRFFAEGIHGELITQLAKISGLRVIARSSVQQFRDGARDLGAISRTLGAGTILEGTVQRDGTRVRIAVQLVDPRTRQEIWADRFDRDMADVFAIQTEVALEIARTLGAKISAAERRLVERPPTRDREAHDLYLRAVRYWERSMDVLADNRKAEELLQAAVGRDPSFALAHAWLAIVKGGLADCKAGRLHAERALALEPDLPQAHAALADVRWNCDHDALAAVRELEIAVRDAPGDAMARASLGSLMTLVGRFDEGLSELHMALAIDPQSYFVAAQLAQELTLVRRFDEAARACRQAQELSPADAYALVMCALIPAWRDGDLGPAREAAASLPRDLPAGGVGAWSLLQLLAFLPSEALELAEAGLLRDPFSSEPFIPRAFVVGAAHAALGHTQLARAQFATALAPLEARVAAAPDDTPARLLLARAYAGVGRPDDALRESRRAISEVREVQRKASALRLAADVATAAGRRDEALEWLGAILARRDGLLTPASVRVDPRFAPLRGDARFAALVGEKSAAARPR
jgi:TolB-like protein/Tfp pilus assembly protein PilF